MRFLVWGIVNFDAILLIMILGVSLVSFFHRGALIFWLNHTIAIGFFVTVLTPFPGMYVAHLENTYPVVRTVPDDVKGVLVIGGMISRDVSVSRKQAAFSINGPRMSHVIKLMHEKPGLPYFFMAGGVPYINHYQEGDILRRHLSYVQKEVPNITYDTRSNTTAESAHVSYRELNPGNDKWLLVTSAYHMPRAVRNFTAAGWNVTPYPTDYKTKKNEGYSFNFSIFKGIMFWKIAVHEFLMHVIDSLDGRIK
ncbi:MAG: YdcF family protein [Alphaproteobacteria bacterium]|nr:MAG: YdcF family protein [Alphaproteobacteria bacterium]